MILLCSGAQSSKAFDAVLCLATTLHGRGHTVAIDGRFVPDPFSKQERYEAAPFLADIGDIQADHVIIVGAQEVRDDVQLLLRSTPMSPDAQVFALGRYATQQDKINTANRVAYATGREPEMVDLALVQRIPLLDGDLNVPAAVFKDIQDDRNTDTAQVLVYVPKEDLEAGETLPLLVGLGHQAGVKLHILTSGSGKTLIQNSRFNGLSVFGVNELPPQTLANFADFLVFFGTNVPGPRMANLAMHAMAAGTPVIDCTSNAALRDTGAPVVEGPQSIIALGPYLSSSVLKNRSGIGAQAQKSDWLKHCDIGWLETAMGITPPPKTDVTQDPATLFYPTNGNGLGHAQRCAVIAEAMAPAHRVQFAAFPSCVDLLRNRGFPVAPMVQRTEAHAEEYANDLVNYLRLRGILRAGDQFVFDGGYVFDSIYRIIAELHLPAVWIRRGLWQSGQVKASALERERVFSKVIVPQEAFEELNSTYSQGNHIHHVGPIVRTATPDDPAIRDKLAKMFGRPADELVVTMLGGGVASERSVQTQMVCSTLEPRKNCIHLIVAWPNAVVPNGLYGWKNSHVINTQNTGALCRAADLTISAVGYNSFHEIMYSKLPSIMIPQSAPYLDDQEKRARAASERGLTSLVLESELSRLKQEVSAYLDGGKADEIRAALAQVNLPETGNRSAAQIIENGART